jgi:cyclopropane-fatty-acyl-phospholipid synthase
VSDVLAPVLAPLGDLPVGIRFWDKSELGEASADATIVVSSPRALSYLLFGRGQLGFARAYVSGEIDVEGDLYAALGIGDHLRSLGEAGKANVTFVDRLHLLAAMARVGALRRPPPPPAEEIRLRGNQHSRARDQAAISSHYDISNDFYSVILGPSMVYSCAYFAEPSYTLEQAQLAKCDLICNKLGLKADDRLLDVGCGWGTMVMHAARHYGVRAVGITVSHAQAELARARVAKAGLSDRVEVRVQDYRDVQDGPYDAISSIGMFEHVGLERMREYFVVLRDQLKVGGRLMNHAISRPSELRDGRTTFGKYSFVDRYVFPDGELLEVGKVVSVMQSVGLEVRDLECLREHYARTLRSWVANLEENFAPMAALVGEGRARVWRLYMAASAINFDANRTSIDQVLAVRTPSNGDAQMPSNRSIFRAREEAVRDLD